MLRTHAPCKRSIAQCFQRSVSVYGLFQRPLEVKYRTDSGLGRIVSAENDVIAQHGAAEPSSSRSFRTPDSLRRDIFVASACDPFADPRTREQPQGVLREVWGWQLSRATARLGLWQVLSLPSLPVASSASHVSEFHKCGVAKISSARPGASYLPRTT